MNTDDKDNKPERCPTCGMCTAKDVVELCPAYMWDCPNCGRENFQRAVTVALTDEDRLEMELGPDELGSWQSYPNVVICRFCEMQYKTRHIIQDNNEDSNENGQDD